MATCIDELTSCVCVFVIDHHVVGRPQDRIKVPVAADATGGSLGNCATEAGAIYYYERTSGSEI